MAINKEYNDIQLDVKFTQASTRANLVSEENISVSFGKISKYFADLHSQAFTGYKHPTHTAYSSGLYKITVDGLGHVTSATTVTGSDLPAHEHPYLPNTTKYALSDSVGGSAKTADKLTTSRTITIGTGVTSTATSFDGSANITIPITGIKEAYLTWGGKDFSSSFSPLDAALEPRLGANRLEMCPGSGIKIERTTDGGTTWTEVSTSSISNTQRSALFSSAGYEVPVSATSTAGMGNNAAKYMMRITLDTSVANVYTNLLKFILNISTNGCANCYVKLRIRTAANVSAGNDTWLTWDKTNKTWSSSPTEANTKCPIGGWSSYNVINFATFTTYGNQTSHYRNVQFIFGCSQNDSTYPGLSIINIQGYGGVAWNAPSNMARTGHLYSWNGNGDASFPASVTATNFTGKINTMTITGTTSGSYDLNTFLTEHPTITKSADTTSTASPAHGGTFTVVDSVTREANGHVTKINTKTITLPADSNTDTKVTQSSSTTSDFRPLLLGKNNQTNPENLETTVTDQTYVTKHVFVQPSTGNLTLYNASGDSPSLIFRRGTMIDNLNDWKIYVSGGGLYFAQSTANASSETWTNRMYFHPSDGNLYVGSTKVSLSNHTHGNITSGGALQTTDITIASGDKLVVTDSSDSNKVARTSISFDGSTATKCLTQKGTWETFAGSNTDRYVNSAAFTDDSTNTAASPVKMTLTRAGSDTATVTANIPKVSSTSAGVAPKGATVSSQSQSTKFLREDGSWAVPSYTSIPSNNVTGSGTSGYLTKWNGTHTITNGPQLGSSTTTFLRNDGTWATPPGTYTHPTYTRTDTTSTASPAHGETFTAIDSVTATNGHVTAVNVKTVTLPAQYVHPGKTQTDTTSTTSPAHGGTFTVVDSVTRDTYGHVSGINVKTVTLPSDQNTDTKVKVTANTTTKGYLIASTTSPNGTAVEGIADTGVYLDTTAGGLCATNVKASSTVCANTANSTSAGGIALYSTDPETYGIMFRGTSNSGKHGYVQSDWATYFTMNQGATTRGWIFRKKTDGPVASISGAGNAVFNGSVTVGGNSTNTSGCRMEYNSTTQSLDFVFV